MSNQIDLAIVLAAGEGTRMKSTTAKVLHRIAGQTLLGHVLHSVESLTPKEIRVVVGSQSEEVTAHLGEIAPRTKIVTQAQRNGTGHATRLALEGAPATGRVIVLAGDTPLLTGKTLAELLGEHIKSGADASVMTAELPDPFGYGRIIRDGDDDQLLRIVEEKDASLEEKEVDEINSGVYIFDIASLRAGLAQITTKNEQGEEYLTDVIAIMKKAGKKVIPILVTDFTEILGINDRAQLSDCAAFMRDRINTALMLSGVSIIDPTTTWIDLSVEIAPDVTIHPGTSLAGKCVIETGAIIGPRTTMIDCQVGQNGEVLESYCVGSVIGYGASVGPFTYLRKGTELATNSRAGAFVEMKNAILGEGSKVPHLSYVGDATIGKGSNIGAATIFVNYDGVEKHHTEVGDHVRIGSDSMLVAPLTIGDGAYTAAGSVITEDVPAGAMGVGRARQRNILGWVLRKRSGTKSAQAAGESPTSKKSERDVKGSAS